MTTSEWKNKLYYGDNLVWLRDKDHFPNESVDLIYLDPPFNSNADYNVIFKEPGGDESPAQVRAFDDTWKWDGAASEKALRDLGIVKPDVVGLLQWIAGKGDKFSKSMAAYLSMMAVRLVELHRVLKPTGSFYLHCDPTASHYLKLVLDQVLGPGNFRNEIIWHHQILGAGLKAFPKQHEILLRYTKSGRFKFNPKDKLVRVPFSKYILDTLQKDEHGYYYTRRRMTRKATPEELARKASTKTYVDVAMGRLAGDVWSDFPSYQPKGAERLGYPTQKPLELLERIISASSDECDVVLDPFCGCGTTVVAAQELNRRWVGIDVTWLAIDLIEKRLKNSFGNTATASYKVYGRPHDVPSARALAEKSKSEFEIWALSLVGAAPRTHDGGVDGLLSIVEGKDRSTKIIVQVKGGRGVNPGMVRDLIGTVEKEGAAIGLLVTLEEPTAGMKELAVHAASYTSPVWGKSYPRIQIRTVGELLEGKRFDLPYGESPMKKAVPIREPRRTKPML